MDLPYFLLYVTVLSLWLPKIRGLRPWCAFLASAVISGFIPGYLSWAALFPIFLMALAVFILPRFRTAGSLLLLITGLGLGAHLFPGFENLLVLDKVRISSDGIPFTLYLNFDKTLIGIFILGSMPSLITQGREWLRILKEVGTRGLMMTLGLACVALVLGFVRVDPKIPDSLPIWAATNLLLVCVAEEAFFRGFLQGQLAEALQRFRYGKISAILIAAILFGIAHFAGGIKYVILASLAGAGYGWMYHRTGRIEASILTHFSLNLFHFLVLTYPALAM